jgi:hypothetical protein
LSEGRGLQDLYSYEKYRTISKESKKKYFWQFKLQIILLLTIAFLSLFPSFNDERDTIRHVIELILIISVFIIMISQYKSNYINGWQSSRFLAETILSNAWLFVWKSKPFDLNEEESENIFREIIRKLKNEINVQDFDWLYVDQKGRISIEEPSNLMITLRNSNIDSKKYNYVQTRLKNQICWYSEKASFNKMRSTQCFWAGLLLMGTGAILTVLIIAKWLPDLSYLGFFTTASASVFSWSQAERYDKLKITYDLSAYELREFEQKINRMSNEDELVELIENIENVISREHKIWLEKKQMR